MSDADQIAAHDLKQVIETATAAGFVVEETGGNCTALVRKLAGPFSIYIVGGDPEIPASLDSECCALLMTEEHGEQILEQQFKTTREAIQWIGTRL